jgi:hypothetical protein
VEKVALGSTAILEHPAGKLLSKNKFSEIDHLTALKGHNIYDEIRLFADTKLARLVKATNINFLDRLEIVLRIADLASLRGDGYLFNQAKKQFEILSSYFPSYVTSSLKSDLHSVLFLWIETKRGYLKKNQIALLDSKLNHKLLFISVFLLFIPFYQDNAAIQNVTMITGIILLLATFDQRIRYYSSGYKTHPI